MKTEPPGSSVAQSDMVLPSSRYGRTLAYVIVGTTVVNEVRLRERHAAALHIPPCGNDTAECYAYLRTERTGPQLVKIRGTFTGIRGEWRGMGSRHHVP